MSPRAQATEARDSLPRFQRLGVRGLSWTRFYRSLPLREKLLVLGALVLPIPLALAGLAIPLLGSVARSAGSLVVLESIEPPPTNVKDESRVTRASGGATSSLGDEESAVSFDANPSTKTAGDARPGGGPSADGKSGATGNDGGGAGAPGRPDDDPGDAGPRPGDDGPGTMPVPTPPLPEASGAPVAAIADGDITVPVDAAGAEVSVGDEGVGLEAGGEELDVALPQVPVVNAPPLP